jgi:hypothetical protein
MLDKARIIIMQISLRFLKLFAFSVSENFFHTCKFQMTVAKNDNQEQNNISDINAKFQEILALAKEIEQLTMSEKN